MPAEVAEQRRQFFIRGVGQAFGERVAVGQRRVAHDPIARFGTDEADQVLVFLVGHLVDAFAQGGAAGATKGELEAAAVLGFEYLPADALE